MAQKIATYDEVKELPKHPEKILIDVREPNELKETGVIPTSINIPRKFYLILSHAYGNANRNNLFRLIIHANMRYLYNEIF